MQTRDRSDLSVSVVLILCCEDSLMTNQTMHCTEGFRKDKTELKRWFAAYKDVLIKCADRL